VPDPYDTPAPVRRTARGGPQWHGHLGEELDDVHTFDVESWRVIVEQLVEMGFEVEAAHHEVATGGQCEIDMRFSPLVDMADKVLKYKYIVKNVAKKHGKTATFMPKPLFGDNGSGMHCHQSLWKDGEPLFYDELGYAGLSDIARHYIGGLLHHAPSLLAFTNPTVNSYHRLVPGFEAPVNLVYSSGNRSACVRIPITGTNAKAKRIEFRIPDSACNPYLAFAGLLHAGLEGIERGYELPDPMETNLYELTAPERRSLGIESLPESLGEAIAAAEESEVVEKTLGPELRELLLDRLPEAQPCLVQACKPEVALGGEMPVDDGLGDPGLACDVGRRRARIAAGGEHAQRRVDDRRPALVGRKPGRDAHAASRTACRGCSGAVARAWLRTVTAAVSAAANAIAAAV
jgi:glutamine synthetase type I